MIIFSDYNEPYLFAISFVLLIGILEIVSLIFGHMLSGAIDAHFDHFDSLDSGTPGQVLHFLNIGRIPALVVICLLAGFFGLFGILFQHGMVTLWQIPLSNLILGPVSFIAAIFAVHFSGKVIAPGYLAMKRLPLPKMSILAKWPLLLGIGRYREPPAKADLQINMDNYIIYYWNPKKESRFKKETRF